MQTYKIEFQVMTNSQVYINDEDYSSFVNTQDRLISYNAAISPIGENVIDITVPPILSHEYCKPYNI